MRKKISIWSLTVFFLLSTTGLPIWYHYCEVAGKKAITECDDCTIKKQSDSCCEKESSTSAVNFATANSNCCIDIFDYKKVEDHFSQTITPGFYTTSLIIVEVGSSPKDDISEINFSQKENLDLPPPKFGKELLKTIHQLKIDLPVC